MNKDFRMRAIPALAGAIFSGAAGAAGFQLLEQNASGIGNAYAGSAAVADNASTVFFNPAGMTRLQAREFSGGLTGVRPSFRFSNGASNPNVLPVPGGSSNVLAGNGGDGGSLGIVPNAYLSWALGRDWYAGLGVGAPFGLMTEYDRGWLGGAQSTKFQITTVNVNPSLAYRVNEAVSIGAGINWQKLDAEYLRQVGTADYALAGLPMASSTARLKLSDDTWGWNAGILFDLSPATRVGLSYRSAMKYTATGDITVNSTSALLRASSANAKAEIKLPDVFIVSAVHRLGEHWELLGDISRTGWSSIPKVDIVATTGPAAGTPVQTLGTNFRDTWRAAVGATCRMSETLKLKMGIAYDQTPVKGASSRLVSLPDNDRTWLSLGGQWKPGRDSALDVGVAYLYVRDAQIHNDQRTASPATNRGLVDGTYKDNAWIVGAQYSAAF